MKTAEGPLQTAEEPLRLQIDRVQAKLGGLQGDLAAVDGELSELAPQREQYGLVQNVCESLDKLRDLGVAGMFWGERADEREAEQHVRQVRERLEVFTAQINVIERKRQALLDDVKHGQDILNILAGDLHAIQEEEDERRREWLIERDAGPIDTRPQQMPWSRTGDDDRRFRKALLTTMLAVLFVGGIVPIIPLPERDPELVLEDVPERIVRFIELDRPTPPPPVVEEILPEEPEPVEPEPVVASEVAPEAPPVEEPPPVPIPEPAPRQRAETAGILAFRESFAPAAERRPAARLGADARVNSAGEGDGRVPTRSLVTSLAPGSSGGVNLASFSRDVGGDGGGGGSLAGVDVGRVESAIDGAGNGAGRPTAGGGGALAGRTDEEIQIVFDRYKASLYRLNNRELRNDPTLRGQMVLRLTIEPNGTVSMLTLHSTDMNAPLLIEQVLERVRTFDFGAKDVAPITIIYPIDFLPAA